jgi:Flp pilus assembly protein protease CpaA
MLVLLSHAAGFASLLMASAYDLKSGEVPDYVSVIGITAGLILHAGASIQMGSIEPLLWSLGVGIGFSIVGWAAYFLGGWGGADALALGVLGFTAPYGLSGISAGYSINLVVNLLLAGLGLTLLWSSYLALKTPKKVLSKSLENLKQDKMRLTAEITVSLFISYIAGRAGLNGFLYGVFFVTMIFLLRFMRAIESEVFKKEKEIAEVEVGEIVEADGMDGLIRGIEEDELEELKESDVETVYVKSGIRFVPVFPIALLLTDFTGLGIRMLVSFFAFGV